MDKIVLKYGQLESAVRAHDWIHSRDDVNPADYPDVGVLNDSDYELEQRKWILDRLLPMPTKIESLHEVKCFFAHEIVVNFRKISPVDALDAEQQDLPYFFNMYKSVVFTGGMDMIPTRAYEMITELLYEFVLI